MSDLPEEPFPTVEHARFQDIVHTVTVTNPDNQGESFTIDSVDDLARMIFKLLKAGDTCAVACRVMGASTFADEWEAAKKMIKQ